MIPVLLVLGGGLLIGGVMFVGLMLIEYFDGKAAEKVRARNAAIEADPAQRQKWEDMLG